MLQLFLLNEAQIERVRSGNEWSAIMRICIVNEIEQTFWRVREQKRNDDGNMECVIWIWTFIVTQEIDNRHAIQAHISAGHRGGGDTSTPPP